MLVFGGASSLPPNLPWCQAAGPWKPVTWNGKGSGEDDDMMTFEETHGFVFFSVHLSWKSWWFCKFLISKGCVLWIFGCRWFAFVKSLLRKGWNNQLDNHKSWAIVQPYEFRGWFLYMSKWFPSSFHQDISRLTDPEGWVAWTAVSILQKGCCYNRDHLNNPFGENQTAQTMQTYANFEGFPLYQAKIHHTLSKTDPGKKMSCASAQAYYHWVVSGLRNGLESTRVERGTRFPSLSQKTTMDTALSLSSTRRAPTESTWISQRTLMAQKYQ